MSTLQQLRNLGVRVALDDFGKGHSDLGHMLRFPFSKIKIDQSRIQELDCVADANAIVRALIVLGHGAGMRSGAKGVETPEQAELLRKEGCEEVQGHYFSRPMLAKDLENLVVSEKVLVA